MFTTFCLRLAAGMALALLVLPAREVQPRFYRIHLLIVLGLACAAAMAAGDSGADLFWLALGLGIGGTVVGTWAWSLERAPGGFACLLVATASLLTASVGLVLPSAATLAIVVGLVANGLTAAGLLGLAMTAMLMGHWYLIAPTMSLRPLMRLLVWLFVMLALRLAAAAVGLIVWDRPAMDSLTWWWLALRWGAGLIGPAILGWMAWQSARIRSTQSATGILYVLVIFVFLGELTAQLLHGHARQWL